MTSPEHTLVGVLGAMSLGLNQRLGWNAIVFAGVVSNIPDLDGVPMLFDMARFESGHRVWGHNLLAILVTSVVVALLQYRFRLIETLAEKLRRFAPKDVAIPEAKSTPPVSLQALLIVG